VEDRERLAQLQALEELTMARHRADPHPCGLDPHIAELTVQVVDVD
jgi:hypothetical protein